MERSLILCDTGCFTIEEQLIYNIILISNVQPSDLIIFIDYTQFKVIKKIMINHKLDSKFPGEISTTSDTQMAESKEELKSLLIQAKEESEKAGLKTQH